MKLTKLYRDTAKVADVASVANSGSIVIYTHSVRDEEEICDEIIRRVNAHDALIEACAASLRHISAQSPNGDSPLCRELRTALALAKGETS